MRRSFASVILLLLSVLSVQAADGPTFSAVEISLSKPGGRGGGAGFMPGGRFNARNATMLDLISTGYAVEPEAVVGGPNWLETTRFDINARGDSKADQATLKVMVQNMLADRFALKLHQDQKAMPSFALTVSKRGLKMKESTVPGPADCDGNGGGPTDITIVCHGFTMTDFVQQMRGNARGYFTDPMVDMTGLKGTYDFTLTWTPKGQLRKPGDTDTDKPAGTSVFDALEKQLGLHVEPQKTAVPVLVIDSANEKFTPNAGDVTSKLKTATEFEVADIHPSAPGTQMNANMQPGGRLDVQGVTMQFLLTVAYGVDKDMIIAPKWFETDKFNIVAKAPREVGQDELETMLRALLADRFKLKIHNEDQPITVYALVVGKRGPRMKESTGEGRQSCKISAGEGKRNYSCQNTTMAQLAANLRQQAPGYIDHAVIDKTELKGAYDFVLSWTPRQQFQGGGRGGNADPSAPPREGASDPNGDMTLQEALDRMLGLRLEPTKHPMPVIVVDHAEQKPTEN